MRGRGGGVESRAHVWLDSQVIFPMSLPDVSVDGPLLASIGCGVGAACWEPTSSLFGGSLTACGALGTVVLEAPRPWWCSSPSALREVDPPPRALPRLQVDPPAWAHRHSVAGRPPWARVACHRCCSSGQPNGVSWAVEASSVVARTSSRSSHSVWALASLHRVLLYQARLVSESVGAQ